MVPTTSGAVLESATPCKTKMAARPCSRAAIASPLVSNALGPQSAIFRTPEGRLALTVPSAKAERKAHLRLGTKANHCGGAFLVREPGQRRYDQIHLQVLSKPCPLADSQESRSRSGRGSGKWSSDKGKAPSNTPRRRKAKRHAVTAIEFLSKAKARSIASA